MVENLENLESYQSDASNVKGAVQKVVFADSIEDVQALVRLCSEEGVGLSISGNGTGLVGGRVAPDGVLLSLERMQSCDIDAAQKIARVQAGMSMSDFQALVSNEGLLYSPDPTEWSAALGGTWATNASGARTFKYGPTRTYVEGLRVVLSDAELLDFRRGDFVAKGYTLRLTSESGREYNVPIPRYTMPTTTKHAAGYYAQENMDAVDLFIGSEGTLGILVEATLRLHAAPQKLLGMIVFFESYDRCLSAVEELRKTRRQSAPISPRLIEFFDRNALTFISSTYANIPTDAACALWLEQEYNEELEDSVYSEWMNFISTHSALYDLAWFAYDERRHAELRAFRHALPSAVYEKISATRQTKIGTDIAVPEQHFREYFEFYQTIFAANNVDYVLFGHIGDCHLHANIFTSENCSAEQSQQIYDSCIKKGLELGGTVSAEHGIGKLKRKYLQQMWGDEFIDQMRQTKKALDPKNLLSAGNMFEV